MNHGSLNLVFHGDISAWMIKAAYRSVNRMIISEWGREGNLVRLKVTVPGNTHATIHADEIREVGAVECEFLFDV